MSALQIIADLAVVGVRLYLDDAGGLRVRGSRNLYTDAWRAKVAACRNEIMELLPAAPVASANAPLAVPVARLADTADKPHIAGLTGESLPPALASPVDDLTALGGHDGAAARFGPERAHRLWDSARLWERDLGTPREARWLTQYLEARAAIEGETPCS